MTIKVDLSGVQIYPGEELIWSRNCNKDVILMGMMVRMMTSIIIVIINCMFVLTR